MSCAGYNHPNQKRSKRRRKLAKMRLSCRLLVLSIFSILLINLVTVSCQNEEIQENSELEKEKFLPNIDINLAQNKADGLASEKSSETDKEKIEKRDIPQQIPNQKIPNPPAQNGNNNNINNNVNNINNVRIRDLSLMNEQQIVDFLQKAGSGYIDHKLTLEEVKNFDHQQLDDYLAKTTLTDAQKHKIRHQVFHMKHKGHEAMHTEMVLIMIVMLIVGQILLVHWRKKALKSYNTCTLILLWLTPLVGSVYYKWWRFVTIWSIFSFFVAMPVRKAVFTKSGQSLPPEIPRMVYRIFLFMFRLSLSVGTVGYLCFLFTMLGLNLTFQISPDTAFDFSFLCLWYGFYFGVVIRDFSDLCATSIAVKGKFYKEDKTGNRKNEGRFLPQRQLEKGTCAMCGFKLCGKKLDSTLRDAGRHNTMNNNQINNFSADTKLLDINLEDFSDAAYGVQHREPNTSDDEKSIVLTCGHEFHEYCIRGWVILGKQSTCPYCNEKVDTKILGNHPWEKYNRMYAQLLEWLRYLVAWQPIILIAINGVTHLMGLE